jgi:hypothetical protein
MNDVGPSVTGGLIDVDHVRVAVEAQTRPDQVNPVAAWRTSPYSPAPGVRVGDARARAFTSL